jgi:hypothetical protein
MTSSSFLNPLAGLFLITSAATSFADVHFGPILAGAGQSVRLVSRAHTENGTITQEENGRSSKGTVTFSRDRELTWTFRDPAPDGSLRGMVNVTASSTLSSVTLNGKTEKIEDQSPLTGKMFAMSKPVHGEWKFTLDGSLPQQRIENEINELAIYLKRQWYPQRKVTIGESWEFDPTWIRMLVERDLKQAQLIGTMKLRQIRHATGRDAAIIGISVKGSGADFQADGTETSVQIDLSGQVTVNLKTMLDESFDMEGTIISRVGKPGNSKTVTLPLRLQVNKTLVNP